ncbi:MAG: cytochrome-c peroxidase [Albidovulum sp.]|nr:cytochrome-c peroxidase [Albidovulum sp.]MDE0307534.1 cytochrome-c peroxidase [Albidovulum sp.]MDE0530203.1 cytochrome-c peroxidase [Albidovulum sp.]
MYPVVDPAEAELGQLLFYDPILSGSRKVACASCHHPSFGTSDGVSLGLGDGGVGIGPDRIADPTNLPERRVPRNSPGLWNVGAFEFRSLFHDGRVELGGSQPDGVRTPLDRDMMSGFASVLAAQTMFPVVSPDEMAGHYSENSIAEIVRLGILTEEGGAWDRIARNVARSGDYAERFKRVYWHIDGADDVTFVDISNAIAAFIAHEFRSDTSPFDAHLRGEAELSPDEKVGMELFFGSAGCSSCHSGPFLTDHEFHAMGDPQLGPGKAARFEHHARDEGRFRVTGNPADRFAFRTPSLRNVALTAPYGHAGAFADLRSYIRHHIDPVDGLNRYDRRQVILPELSVNDWRIMDDPAETGAIAASVELAPQSLSEGEIAALAAFLNSLTDPIAVSGRLGVPGEVPSGLAVPNR